jgi:hypothetical protein
MMKVKKEKKMRRMRKKLVGKSEENVGGANEEEPKTGT